MHWTKKKSYKNTSIMMQLKARNSQSNKTKKNSANRRKQKSCPWVHKRDKSKHWDRKRKGLLKLQSSKFKQHSWLIYKWGPNLQILFCKVRTESGWLLILPIGEIWKTWIAFPWGIEQLNCKVRNSGRIPGHMRSNYMCMCCPCFVVNLWR